MANNADLCTLIKFIKMEIFLFIVAHWYLSLFAQSFFHHRYSAHQMFTMPKWVEKFFLAGSLLVKVLWSLFYIWFYYTFATAWWMYLFVPMHIVMGPVHGTIVNWFAHKFGYTNYKVDDTSKNLMPFDIFMLGEGYHNNHHAEGGMANFARKWYEIDPIYPIMRVMDWVGLIRINPVALKS